MRFLRKSVVCLAAALALLASAGMATAQQGAATIRGTVLDSSGAVVPGAKVTITNLGTNLMREQSTTAAGTFSFDLIPQGDYKVEVSTQGFKKKIITPVHALVGNIAEIKAEMEVGELSAVVTVEGTSTAVQVNTQDATLGNNIVSKQIIALPMEGRNLVALLTLQPGVTGAPGASGYVAGARSDQSNVTLDGVDINEAQTSRLDGGTVTTNGNDTISARGGDSKPVLRLNSEAIEEFRVTTVNSNANQGRSSGAQINLVTKSGTNQFHGSAFEYHRNTIFTANDFFNQIATPRIERPKLIRNLFGGTIGGPIWKDKLFFFYSYEGRRDASAATGTSVVPLASLGQGIMNADVANCQSGCPTYRVQVTAAQFTTIYPDLAAAGGATNPTGINALRDAATRYPANSTAAGDGVNTGGFRFNVGTPVNLNSNVAKIDWTMNSKMSLSFRLNAIYDLSSQTPNFPDTTVPQVWEHPWGGVVNHNWQIGRNWVNNFRYGITRQAFSQQGDSAQNSISFRFVFNPLLQTRTVNRTTPVHNIVDDISWVKGSHTFGFGANIRLISNDRQTFSNAFDQALTNPSWYAGGGSTISTPIRSFLRMQLAQPNLVIISNASVQNAATALIGRLSQYTTNFTFDSTANGGALLPSGSPADRSFKTQEYDLYFQDSWKLSRDITITYGLRYGISRPVYEAAGFEVKPTLPMDEFLRLRAQNAFNGVDYTQLITLDLSGPANGRSPLYTWDKNNFQPRASVAWSPRFENSWLKAIFGEAGKSVIRSGFAMTNDYYGQALAVAFDLNNSVGFTSARTIGVNTYNVTTNPAPLFTSFNQSVRTLPGVVIPGPVSFPQTPPGATPATLGSFRRIESGLEEGLTAPVNYVFNLTVERELPKGLVFSASYIGRLGRKLLAQRDAMSLINLRDPQSGVDWYTAGRYLEQFRQSTNLPFLDTTNSTTTAATLPAFLAAYVPAFNAAFPASHPVNQYFNHFLPANMADNYFNCCSFSTLPFSSLTPAQTALFIAYDQGWANDWTDTQDQMEQAAGRFLFFQPQWGALNNWSTVGNSNFHAATFSLRQRYKDLLWDFNYTYSHSLDDASGLQSNGNYSTSAFIPNPFRQGDNYGHSTFDIRHQINANAIYALPFGRGKAFGTDVSKGWDAVIGGWQLSGILRWNTGIPAIAAFDDARWSTNWNVQSSGTQIADVNQCPGRGTATARPSLFQCDPTAMYRSFRNAYPGEIGLRNPFRLPQYVNLDMGLTKKFHMPWNENHMFELRWEVFNAFNHQSLGTVDISRTGMGIGADPVMNGLVAPANFGAFQATQAPAGQNGGYRVMQIGARFQF